MLRVPRTKKDSPCKVTGTTSPEKPTDGSTDVTDGGPGRSLEVQPASHNPTINTIERQAIDVKASRRLARFARWWLRETCFTSYLEMPAFVANRAIRAARSGTPRGR